jgi:hypothetical protein
MTCARCGSDRLYQFQPSGPLKEAKLPCVCRACGQITVGGEVVHFPDELEQQTVTLAEAASRSAEQAASELEQEPALTERERLEGYMANFYSKAYLDGFFRAGGFFRHEQKEGRLRRLRELWYQARLDSSRGSSGVVVRMDGDAYTEFVQLLHLSVAGKKHAPSSSNESPPVSQSSSRLP